MLAKWERQHEKLFKTMHDRAFEQYASMPWGGLSHGTAPGDPRVTRAL
jgi:hypothetical protein